MDSATGVFISGFLGWALDSFDFFIVVFCYGAIAHEFNVGVRCVAFATMLTLICRPVGAWAFGALAERVGRRPVLMLDILLFAGLEVATALSPNLTVFLVLRALFGVAMGGEWGLSVSLTMETVPFRLRGVLSGILQQGYAVGFMFASVASFLLPEIGWRGVFLIGGLPALLVLVIRYGVPESKAWLEAKERTVTPRPLQLIRQHWRLILTAIALMAAFNFFSHGTQDFYPHFLRETRHLSNQMVSTLSIAGSVGAIIGGIMFGALSQHIGRSKSIVTAAVLVLPVIPLWAYGPGPLLLGLGAFLVQFCVQGAWGVVPAFLSELSPPSARATFPGTIFQIGTLIGSLNVPVQSTIAMNFGEGYGSALVLVALFSSVMIIGLATRPMLRDRTTSQLPSAAVLVEIE